VVVVALLLSLMAAFFWMGVASLFFSTLHHTQQQHFLEQLCPEEVVVVALLLSLLAAFFWMGVFPPMHHQIHCFLFPAELTSYCFLFDVLVVHLFCGGLVFQNPSNCRLHLRVSGILWKLASFLFFKNLLTTVDYRNPLHSQSQRPTLHHLLQTDVPLFSWLGIGTQFIGGGT
jgi:hypothetical protein